MLVRICQFRDGSDLVLKCKNASFKGIVYSVNVVDCCPGNAKNGLSESVDFKILWGSMPPDPHSSLVPSALDSAYSSPHIAYSSNSFWEGWGLDNQCGWLTLKRSDVLAYQFLLLSVLILALLWLCVGARTHHCQRGKQCSEHRRLLCSLLINWLLGAFMFTSCLCYRWNVRFAQGLFIALWISPLIIV